MFKVKNLRLDPLATDTSIGGQLWRGSRRYVIIATAAYSVRAVSTALTPLVMGRVIDAGLEAGLTGPVLRELGLLTLLLATFLIGFIISKACQMRADIGAGFRCTTSTHSHITRIGAAAGQRHSTGEMVTTISADPPRIGGLFRILPEFIGGLIAFLVVTAIAFSYSPTIGLTVAIGGPLVALVTSKLVIPFEKMTAAARAEAGILSALGTDTVTGLRVLRGIGGEGEFTASYRAQSQKVRRAGNRIARYISWLEGLEPALSGAFIVLVSYLGARATLAGQMTAGDFAALFGVTVYLKLPLTIIIVTLLNRAGYRVGLARMAAIMATEPDAGSRAEREADEGPGRATTSGRAYRSEPDPLFTAELTDPFTGATISPGRLTGIVSADPAHSTALLTRLARLDDSCAGRIGGLNLADLELTRVRENILFASANAELFAGQLRAVVDPWGGHPLHVPEHAEVLRAAREAPSGSLIAPFPPEAEPYMRDDLILSALADAEGRDILDSVGGLDGHITEKGLSLSGGQRQRLGLARALLADPHVLLLADPTSALDSHTEDRITTRLARRRAGRTTVVASSSPLVLARMDDIIVLGERDIIARGSHTELLARARDGEAGAITYTKIIARLGGGA